MLRIYEQVFFYFGIETTVIFLTELDSNTSFCNLPWMTAHVQSVFDWYRSHDSLTFQGLVPARAAMLPSGKL